jgi:hypothetical protein
LNHNTLENYYKVVFNLVQQHKFVTVSDLENLIPFERDIYMAMIKEEVEKREEEAKQARMRAEAMQRKGY